MPSILPNNEDDDDREDSSEKAPGRSQGKFKPNLRDKVEDSGKNAKDFGVVARADYKWNSGDT